MPTGDMLKGFENVVGSDGDDEITGDNMNNVLNGGAGGDTLNGGAGDDTLNGGAGDDTLDGGAGADTLYGGAGDDTLSGGDGADKFIVMKGEGADTVAAGFVLRDEDMIVLKGFTTKERTARTTEVDVSGADAEIKVMGTVVLTVTGITDLRLSDLTWEP